MTEEPTRAAPLDPGWAALGNGDWEGARASFQDSLLKGETPEALEGMGWAGQMLNDDRLTFDARERAYRLYLERGEKGSAARLAAWLAADHLLFRGEPAVANGWLQRAHSLIDVSGTQIHPSCCSGVFVDQSAEPVAWVELV